MVSIIKVVSGGVAVVGLAVLATSIVVGWVIAPNLIENKVEEETQLRNGSEIYEKWRNIPIPIYLKFYVFNITNSQDFEGVEDWSRKAIVQESGPYVYKEKRTKYEIQSHEEHDTVSYRQNISYTFVPEMSAGPDTDLVNIINVPLFSVAAVLSTVQNLPIPAPWITSLLLSPLSKERLIKRDVPVREVLFGWRLNSIYDIIQELGLRQNLSFPPEMQGGRFGFYLNRNGVNADGNWEVYSGVRDSSRFSVLKKIDGGRERLDGWWEGDCAMINGTDGTMFPPLLKKSSTLYAYIPEICRSVWLNYVEDVVYEGIQGYRFRIPQSLFTSPLEYPPNACFCMRVKPPLVGDCDFTGGGRIFSCKSDAPIIISKPHFLDAQPDVFDKVGGLVPVKEKHDTFIDVEPYTGLPLRAQKRLQIGIELQPLPLGAPWNTVKHVFFPAIWADEEAALDEPLVKEIKDKLVKPLRLVRIGKWTGLGVGIALALTASTYFVYLQWIKK